MSITVAAEVAHKTKLYIDSETVYTEFCDIWTRTFNKDASNSIDDFDWSNGKNRTIDILQSDVSWHMETVDGITTPLTEGMSIENDKYRQYRPVLLNKPIRNLVVQITEYR